MKAAPFDYFPAADVAEACALLGAGDGEAERLIIAGGQTLVPLMAMRLARPAILIDINGADGFTGIALRDGAVVVGAGTRQAAALASPMIAGHVPLLARALPLVGHQQTRNRGTIGGSLAHGDPAAEIPLVALALDATLVLQSLAGRREVAIADFYLAPMMTTRASDECLVEVRFPHRGGDGRTGVGFHELSARRGDFAVVAAAAQINLDDDGICRRAAVAVGGAHGVPVRAAALEDYLTGRRPDAQSAAALVDEAIDPGDDLHADAGYRRRVARVLVARAIADALRDAGPPP
jgi:CO/xanthine dehydrogenase FAD-binding subunit